MVLAKRPSSFSVRAIVVLLVLLAATATIRVAHASAVPTIVQSASISSTTTSGTPQGLTVTLPNDVTQNHFLYVFFGVAGGNSWSPYSITDDRNSEGFTWNQITTAQDGLLDTVWVYAKQMPSTGAESVHFQISENGCPCGSSYTNLNMTVVEVSGAAAAYNGYESAVESSGGTTHTTSGGIGLVQTSNGVNCLDLGMYLDGGANTTVSQGSGQSALGPNNSPTANAQFAGSSGAGLSRMSWTTAASAGYTALVAISIGSN